jgi:RHS repeat-associated protein
VEFYSSGYAHFPHADWLGTTRSETTNSGAVDGAYSSLAFGDGWTIQGGLYDARQFAGMDWDSASNEHAQYREYSNMAGRWLSPDPYSGSYDMSNPQSFNRYAYVQNNPLSAIDPSGLMMCNGCGDGGGGGPAGGGIWFPGGNGGAFCLFFWCWGGHGGGTPKPQIIGYRKFEDYDPGDIMNDHLGLPPGMRLPTGDLAFTIQMTLGLPTMADVGCLPFCDATNGSAPNSGPGTWTKADAQNCLNGFYQSSGGKVVDALSWGGLLWSPNRADNWADFLMATAGGKGTLYYGMKAGDSIGSLSGVTDISAPLSGAVHSFVPKALKVVGRVVNAFTAVDALVNIGCRVGPVSIDSRAAVSF